MKIRTVLVATFLFICLTGYAGQKASAQSETQTSSSPQVEYKSAAYINEPAPGSSEVVILYFNTKTTDGKTEVSRLEIKQAEIEVQGNAVITRYSSLNRAVINDPDPNAFSATFAKGTATISGSFIDDMFVGKLQRASEKEVDLKAKLTESKASGEWRVKYKGAWINQ